MWFGPFIYIFLLVVGTGQPKKNLTRSCSKSPTESVHLVRKVFFSEELFIISKQSLCGLEAWAHPYPSDATCAISQPHVRAPNSPSNHRDRDNAPSFFPGPWKRQRRRRTRRVSNTWRGQIMPSVAWKRVNNSVLEKKINDFMIPSFFFQKRVNNHILLSVRTVAACRCRFRVSAFCRFKHASI